MGEQSSVLITFELMFNVYDIDLRTVMCACTLASVYNNHVLSAQKDLIEGEQTFHLNRSSSNLLFSVAEGSRLYLMAVHRVVRFIFKGILNRSALIGVP